MTRRTSTTLTGFATALMLGATGVVALPAAYASAPVTLMANLRASGDADGSGHVTIKLNKAKKKVCATATWTNIATPNAAHIHRKSDGGILVDLSGSVTGGAQCATGVSRKKIQKILDHPGRYYFNVHNVPYPAGAIQGNLHR